MAAPSYVEITLNISGDLAIRWKPQSQPMPRYVGAATAVGEIVRVRWYSTTRDRAAVEVGAMPGGLFRVLKYSTVLQRVPFAVTHVR